MIICEKPSAAERIAEALSDGKLVRKKERNLFYYTFEVGEEQITLCSALGHLFGVAQKDQASRREYPVWDYTWKPNHEISQVNKKTKAYIETITALSEDVDKLVNACDYDIEGSVIGYTIIKYACKPAESGRMKFSTLTNQELIKAYKDTTQTLDFPLIYAGMCRHEVDWLYGINLSRALTESARNISGYYVTLSTGRVQGPTLNFIVEREKDVLTHIPTPYWEAYLTLEINGERIEADFSSKITSVSEAEKIEEICKNSFGTVKEVRKALTKMRPPTPFDITTLQTEAYRHFKYPPRTSLNIAERLYLNALISYPRTSSQKLPPSINYEEILRKLEKTKYREYVSKIAGKPLKPAEGPKSDPAHPAIYPTGQKPSKPLSSWEDKIYDLIVKRFISTFAEHALKETIKAEIDVKGYLFLVKGSRILKQGWIETYTPYIKIEEQQIPQMTEGMKVKVLEAVIREKYTQPPSRFNPSSLLKRLEKEGIGTKATRADIIETLYNRGYIEGERIKATILAHEIINVLSQYCHEIIDVDLTKRLEDQMQKIESELTSKEEVIYQSMSKLRTAVDKLKNNEGSIGRALNETIVKLKTNKYALQMNCPKCGATLNVIKSRKTGKRFIGCLGKWAGKCDFSLPLPQKGKLTLLEKKCGKCGFQMIQIKQRARRPLTSCPYCYINQGKNR